MKGEVSVASDDYTVKVWDTKEWRVDLVNDAAGRDERIEGIQAAESEDMNDDD